MSELGFMLLVGLLFVGLVVPLLTLLSKALLFLVRRTSTSATDFDSPVTYLLLIGPVLLPLIWFISSQLHLTEPGQALACHVYDHFVDEPCWEALMAGLGAAAALLLAVRLTLRRPNASSTQQAATHSTCPNAQERIDRLCASHTLLWPLRPRIRAIAETEHHQLYTRGLFQRHIDINETLLNRLDDKACHGALLHELQHLRVFDPLRYLLLSVCTWLNPLGFVLRPDIERWRHARELVCDRDAVLSGADPLSLAHALLIAARPRQRPQHHTAALTGSQEMRWLKVRVGLLTAYAHARPSPPRRRAVRLLVAATVLLLGLGPHWLNAWPLVGLHLGLEDLLNLLTTL